MAATAIAFRSVIANPGRAAAARSAKSWAASKAASSAAFPRGGRGRHGQRRDLPHGFLRNPQRLLAGGHDPQLRAAGQQPLAERGTRVHQVLAVVEHDQRLPRLQRVSQRVLQRAPGLAVDADEGGHPGHDQVRFPQIAQFDRVDAVSEIPGRRGQQPQGQPGLPDPARAAQGESPGTVQGVAQVAEFAFPPDEPVWLLRQLCRQCLWFHFPF